MKNKKSILKLEYIPWFSAKGLKRVYTAQHSRFEGKRVYTIDIWLAKDGRLLMRFHNRCDEADNYAYEIMGMRYEDIPKDKLGSEAWIPDCIFKEFDNWIVSEMPFATTMKEYLACIDRASGTN